jgi:hypothetical protein
MLCLSCLESLPSIYLDTREMRVTPLATHKLCATVAEVLLSVMLAVLCPHTLLLLSWLGGCRWCLCLTGTGWLLPGCTTLLQQTGACVLMWRPYSKSMVLGN